MLPELNFILTMLEVQHPVDIPRNIRSFFANIAALTEAQQRSSRDLTQVRMRMFRYLVSAGEAMEGEKPTRFRALLEVLKSHPELKQMLAETTEGISLLQHLTDGACSFKSPTFPTRPDATRPSLLDFMHGVEEIDLTKIDAEAEQEKLREKKRRREQIDEGQYNSTISIHDLQW